MFSINIYKSTNKIGYRIGLRVLVGQHSRDELLMNSLINKLGCGLIFKHIKINYVTFTVSNFEDIYSKIISLFNKYKIKGVKSLDSKDFVLAAEIIKKRDHLTL
jgi:hypothetical protein